jgi:subtilisin family serine protease
MSWIARALILALIAAALSGGSGAVAVPSDDPIFDKQWALEQINAPEAWEITRGRGATIAVVDTGVDLEHPDLAANIAPGISFCAMEVCPGDGDVEEAEAELCGHGTHVAGIAAAVAGNGAGIAGVAPEAKIIPVDIAEATTTECKLTSIDQGIKWAADQGADVINLSIGTYSALTYFDDATTGNGYRQAMKYALERGALVVAGAGNDSLPGCGSPAMIAGVLCVMATDAAGNHSYYSNFGHKEDDNVLSAPGGAGFVMGGITPESCGDGIVSTVPVGTASGSGCSYDDPSYAEKNGTSMAAPHAAGAAALLRSLGCDAKTTLEVLLSTAHNPVEDTFGEWSPQYGAGILDAAAAVKEAQTKCEPPKPSKKKRKKPKRR